MNTPKNLEGLYSLDVEADGPCSGLYSMLSFALVPLSDPSRAFYTTLAPITDRFVPGALAVCGWTREETLAFRPAAEAMAAMAAWLKTEPGEGRKVIWSDNPAFDWQFFNYYCHAYLDGNPFGHSARRIADFAAGLAGNPRKTSDWKRLRTGKHTHNALDDARGNAGALSKLMAPTIEVRSGYRQSNPSFPPAPSMHVPTKDRGPSPTLPSPASASLRMPLAQVSEYALPTGPDRMQEAVLKAMKQRDGSIRWAVQNPFRMCLNRLGEWEYEPSSSERTDAFFDRCRWATAEDAYQAWERWHATQSGA